MSNQTVSLANGIYEKLKRSTTKISQKVFNVLNREGIADIIADPISKIFWFEEYTRGNNCPQYIYAWLKKFIKREYGYDYLYDRIKPTFLQEV